jgi:hypothetical protein
MPDVTREEFLGGLALDYGVSGNVALYGPDGDHVARVRDNLGLDLSAYQIGSWIVEACHQAARTCETCKHCWQPIHNAAFQWGQCGKHHLEVRADAQCPQWQAKEAADAES